MRIHPRSSALVAGLIIALTSSAAAALYQTILESFPGTPINYIADLGGGPHFYSGPDLHPSGDFADAELNAANLALADLSNAVLTRATFISANLSGANLSGADMEQVRMPWADLTGATLADCSVRFGDLYDAILVNADLSGALLFATELGSSDLTNANLSGADLSYSYLNGADLTGADLTNADLTFAMLENADLSGANLTNANLTEVGLAGAILAGVIVDPAIQPLVDALNAQLAAAQAQLANEYTLSEIADLRPGSAMIEIIGGEAVITMKVEESTDLIEWVDTGETSSVSLPAPNPGVTFFRFGD